MIYVIKHDLWMESALMIDLDTIKLYLNKPCKFRMRNGALVYGVLWSETLGPDVQYFFASLYDYKKYKAALQVGDLARCESLRTPVNLESFASGSIISDSIEAA